MVYRSHHKNYPISYIPLLHSMTVTIEELRNWWATMFTQSKKERKAKTRKNLSKNKEEWTMVHPLFSLMAFKVKTKQYRNYKNNSEIKSNSWYAVYINEQTINLSSTILISYHTIHQILPYVTIYTFINYLDFLSK